MVKLQKSCEANPEDEVVLLGPQGPQLLPAESLARIWGTVNYGVVCGLSARVPRFYHG